MPPENGAREATLQCSKTKTMAAIALKYELHQPIAKAANAVIKNDGMVFWHRYCSLTNFFCSLQIVFHVISYSPLSLPPEVSCFAVPNY